MNIIFLFLFICFCIGLANAIFATIFGIGKLVIEQPFAFIGIVLSLSFIILLIKYLF